MINETSLLFQCKKFLESGHIKCAELNILGAKYEIYLVENVIKHSKEVGLTIMDRGCIIIDKTLSPDRKFFVLLHEILHAVLYELGEKDLSINEPVIYRLCAGIHHFIKSNDLLGVLNNSATGTLNILGLDYAVNYGESERTDINHLYNHNEIVLKTNNDKEFIRLELIQKVINIILFMLGDTKESENKDLIKRLSTGLYQVFKENNLLSPDAVKNIFYNQETKFLFTV